MRGRRPRPKSAHAAPGASSSRTRVARHPPCGRQAAGSCRDRPRATPALRTVGGLAARRERPARPRRERSAAGSDAGAAGPATVAPAVAAGSSSVAAAYVVVAGRRRELHVARLGGDGDSSGSRTVEILDKQHVGTVALAFEDDTLHVVWSSFVPEKKRYVLRWSKWPAGGAPTQPQSIGTGVLSARMPSLAIDRGRFLLAWAEGDEKATTVKVGASRQGLAANPGPRDRRLECRRGARKLRPLRSTSDAMFLAWTERSGAQTSVRASALTVPGVTRARASRASATATPTLASSRLLQETPVPDAARRHERRT